MKTSQLQSATHRAEEALRSLLSTVSTIKLKEISHQTWQDRSKVRFIAHVDVFGHARQLACEVRSSSRPVNLRKTLNELRRSAEQFSADAAPVLIAPSLAPEAQAICKECSTGFLDLEGNARIAVGEVFIGQRTHARRDLARPVADRLTITSIGPLGMPVLSPADGMLRGVPHGVERSQHSGFPVAVA